jgi:cytochrome c556
MISTIAPMSDIIWQAQGISTIEQWQQVEKAALALIAAGNGMMTGGRGENDQFWATQPDWQHYNQQMIDAAKKVIVAVQNNDEDALFETGNLDLYPPCESCHQQYKKW